MNFRLIVGILITVFSLSVVRAQEITVIPNPAVVKATGGEFELKGGRIAYADAELQSEAEFLEHKLSGFGLNVDVKKGGKAKGGILLRLDKGFSVAGSYKLEIASDRIVISGGDRAGVFYGIQTLLQQMSGVVKCGQFVLPCLVVEDAPRYPWRGFMLDEARHFFGKEKVKELLDMMAYYKLNKLHWHLTDEPGWRIEIKKYPRLTTVGSMGTWSNPFSKTMSFYTQEDIKELVAYAAERHIEVIPEIDMPGHATAANKAYPEYSGGGVPAHPDFTFNPGKEEVYQFLSDVLREVAALFPSPYLHIGGDEVAFGIKAWETDPHVQALMKREKMTKVRDAERYFIHRMTDTINRLGKKLIGWDELLEVDADPVNTTIMWWRHDRVNVLKNSLAKGFKTVMCPRRPLYFDFIQLQDHKWGRVWNGFCPLEDVYGFPDKGFASWNLPADQMPLILGVQANLWTERVSTVDRLDFMIYPRLCALAESGWTSVERKDYTDFTRRMESAYRLFDAMGIYYFDARNPANHPEPAGCNRQDKEVPMDFRD